MKRKILVVEDDPAIREMLLILLNRAGFQADGCETAKDGIAAYRAATPELVIIDMGLPDMNGLSAAQEMGMYRGCGVPFIFLTGQHDPMTRGECLHHGANAYINKPINSEDFLGRVKGALQA